MLKAPHSRPPNFCWLRCPVPHRNRFRPSEYPDRLFLELTLPSDTHPASLAHPTLLHALTSLSISHCHDLLRRNIFHYYSPLPIWHTKLISRNSVTFHHIHRPSICQSRRYVSRSMICALSWYRPVFTLVDPHLTQKSNEVFSLVHCNPSHTPNWSLFPPIVVTAIMTFIVFKDSQVQLLGFKRFNTSAILLGTRKSLH